MESRSIRLLQLLLLFAFIHLIISSTADDSSSRIRRVMKGVKETRFHKETVQVSSELKADEEKVSINDRVLDIEDYPGSGANNRHSPPTDGN
ncbi:uncharacterized protein LOC110019478 [Phalaenopsis equestris]|uniref:uncharacterized protein LOC110019478 n=1 Tax=Phalaenopsis equestris TaxID=78828 RepID=UPI0009E5ABAF|nr:uncharacterized protein LOC110019478 [Phalaenopsis equestris]